MKKSKKKRVARAEAAKPADSQDVKRKGRPSTISPFIFPINAYCLVNDYYSHKEESGILADSAYCAGGNSPGSAIGLVSGSLWGTPGQTSPIPPTIGQIASGARPPPSRQRATPCR